MSDRLPIWFFYVAVALPLSGGFGSLFIPDDWYPLGLVALIASYLPLLALMLIIVPGGVLDIVSMTRAEWAAIAHGWCRSKRGAWGCIIIPPLVAAALLQNPWGIDAARDGGAIVLTALTGLWMAMGAANLWIRRRRPGPWPGTTEWLVAEAEKIAAMSEEEIQALCAFNRCRSEIRGTRTLH